MDDRRATHAHSLAQSAAAALFLRRTLFIVASATPNRPELWITGSAAIAGNSRCKGRPGLGVRFNCKRAAVRDGDFARNE